MKFNRWPCDSYIYNYANMLVLHMQLVQRNIKLIDHLCNNKITKHLKLKLLHGIEIFVKNGLIDAA